MGFMFSELHTLIGERVQEMRDAPDHQVDISATLEPFRHMASVDRFRDIYTFGEEHAREFMELAPQVKADLIAKNTVWIMVVRFFNGAKAGTVCQVAASEFEWLKKHEAARLATDAEVVERIAMDDPPPDPCKSLTRSRQIRNTCRALRPVANK